MQLRLKRSQTDKPGLFGKRTWYSLDVLAQFTAQEQALIKRQKLGGTRLFDTTSDDGLFDTAPGAMFGRRKHVWITVDSIMYGHLLEAPVLDKVIHAQAKIKAACEDLQARLDVSGVFQGQEEVIDFSGAKPEVIARASPLADDADDS